LDGRLLSSQSEQFKKLSKSSDWLEKVHFVFGHVNRLNVCLPKQSAHFRTKLSTLAGCWLSSFLVPFAPEMTSAGIILPMSMLLVGEFGTIDESPTTSGDTE